MHARILTGTAPQQIARRFSENPFRHLALHAIGERYTIEGFKGMTEKKPYLTLVDGSLVQQRDVKLTAKQAGFIRSVMGTDANGKPNTLSQAYRDNYDCSNMTDKTVNEKACRLAAQDKIAARLRALEQQKDDTALRSAHSRLEFILGRLELEALGQGDDTNAASRVRALELLGKLAHGGGSLFQERIATEDTRDSGTIRAELEQRLSRLLGGNSAE